MYTNSNSHEYVVREGAVEIAPSAFYGKTNLEIIHLNHGLKKIGYEAFAQTGITTLRLPSTIIHIGKLCIPSTLKDLYVYAATPCPIVEETFPYRNVTRLHVPKNTLEKYKGNPHWRAFADYIEEDYPAEDVGEINNYVTRQVKAKETRKELSKILWAKEVNRLDEIISFGDFHDTCKILFEQQKSIFWLLVQREKLILSESCIKELERLYPRRYKETEMLWRYLRKRSQEDNERPFFDTDYDEPSPRELEMDTFYALGGEDYDAFIESGGDLDSFMDGLGF